MVVAVALVLGMEAPVPVLVLLHAPPPANATLITKEVLEIVVSQVALLAAAPLAALYLALLTVEEAHPDVVASAV